MNKLQGIQMAVPEHIYIVDLVKKAAQSLAVVLNLSTIN